MAFNLIEVTQAVEGIANIATVKAGAPSFSAVLMRNAVAAFIGSDYEANLKQASSLPGWDKAKGNWSSAVNFAKWLRDGNTLKPMANAKKAWLIAGATPAFLDKSHLAALAMDRPASETTVPALIRPWREYRDQKADAAEKAATATEACYAAFLRSPLGQEAYAGYDMTDLATAVAGNIALMGEVLMQGNSQLIAEAAVAENNVKLKAIGDAVAAAIFGMDNMPADMFNRLADAVMLRLEIEAADAAAARVAAQSADMIEKEVRAA